MYSVVLLTFKPEITQNESDCFLVKLRQFYLALTQNDLRKGYSASKPSSFLK